MARSTDFCFKTTYVLGMFWCFRSIVHCFQCFVCGLSPFGKTFPMNPPYPSEITAFESPLPLGISNDLPWVGYGYFLEPQNNFFSKKHMQVVIQSRVLTRKLMNIWKSTATLVQNVQPKNNARARTSVCIRKMATSCGFWRGACAWIQQEARTSFPVINLTARSSLRWDFRTTVQQLLSVR